MAALKYEESLKSEEAKVKDKKNENFQMALINAGLAIAGGSSRYALQNIGQGAQTQQLTASQNATNNIAQLGVAGANAQAGGIMGAANAQANTVGQLGNAGLMYALFSKTPAVVS